MKTEFFFATLGILLLIPAWSTGAGVPGDLQVITEEYAPLNYVENGTLQGISVDLMEEILHRMGSDINRSSFRVMPWHEGYNLTKNTPDTLLLSTARFPEREKLFLWAGPVVTDRKALFMLSDTNLSDKADISLLKIVGVKEDSSIRYATASGADEKNIITVLTAEDAVRMVENRSADAWAYGEIAGQHAITRYADDPSRFVAGKDLGMIEDYFAFNPDTSVEFVKAVNDTLRELKRNRDNSGVTEYERIIARYLPAGCVVSSASREQVMDLVNQTVDAMKNDTPQTVAAINAGESPYRDSVDPDLYVFVFDTKVQIIANAGNPTLSGKSFAGTTDVAGKPFREEMVAGAKKNGNGWVSYVYSNPESPGLYQKMSYYQLVIGSDGEEYIVGAGRYLTCDEIAGNGPV